MTQTDLDVRLQLSGIKFSELSKRLANDLKYGKKCTLKHREDLLLLNIYIEMLECYDLCIPVEEVLSTATLSITSVLLDGSLSLRITPSLVAVGTYTALSTNVVDFMNGLIASINGQTPTSGISAELTEADPPVILLTGSCEDVDIEIVSTDVEYSFIEFSGGVCAVECPEDATCLTEYEVKEIVEKISLLTGICFMPENFTYLEE